MQVQCLEDQVASATKECHRAHEERAREKEAYEQEISTLQANKQTAEYGV